jgi:hypothetical protein
MTSRRTRPSAWHIVSWLLMALAWINAIRVLRHPDALRFFGFWLVVAAVVLAVGSTVALVIIGVRAVTASSETEPPRIT